ncbi:uncharacterized protein LOC116401390 isoform X2 [Anarrhichthys ocellatus]|uniref:uncharacterized protein LOC116401390 isoform X2 n=1 Tax=Anarrhichthys ocellatus TaxID=433405 RepID=UPI0012EDC45A|nr:uncharacterized protein LOC116401390 isoform X2 [Anarrhichthys ocellatus]
MRRPLEMNPQRPSVSSVDGTGFRNPAKKWPTYTLTGKQHKMVFLDHSPDNKFVLLVGDSHLRGIADGFVEMPAVFSYGVMSTPGAAAKDLRTEVLNAVLDRTPDVVCVLAPSNNLTSSRTVIEAGEEFALLLGSVCEKWDEVVVVDFPPGLNVPVDVQEHLRNQYRLKAASAGVRY